MQFSKFMPLVCAAIFCAGFISIRADDNPAQAAARAALEQKMSELDAQQTSTNMEAPPPVTPSGVTQEQPAATAPASLDTTPTPSAELIQRSMMPLPGGNPPAATAPIDIIKPEILPASANTEAQARALQALQQKMSELNQHPAEAPESAPTSPEPQVTAVESAAQAKARALKAEDAAAQAQAEAQKEAALAEQKHAAEAAAAAAKEEARAQAEAQRQALAEKKQAEAKAKGEQSQEAPKVTSTSAASLNYPGKELGLKPIEPPALPISADKQAQLQALLTIYKADKITPAEYQAQRAKILAEP